MITHLDQVPLCKDWLIGIARCQHRMSILQGHVVVVKYAVAKKNAEEHVENEKGEDKKVIVVFRYIER